MHENIKRSNETQNATVCVLIMFNTGFPIKWDETLSLPQKLKDSSNRKSNALYSKKSAKWKQFQHNDCIIIVRRNDHIFWGGGGGVREYM